MFRGLFLAAGLVALCAAQAPDCRRTTSRPARLTSDRQWSKGLNYGTLIVAGGALVRNSLVFQRFLQEAGGPQRAKILYVPTNGGGQYETPAQRERELNSFLATAQWNGLTHPVELVHTYSRAVANTYEFWAPFDEATGVFFSGGLPYWSTDAYLGTQTEAAIDRLLRRGGVLGGTSAGALMQSPIMLRGDYNGNHIVLGSPRVGFGFSGMQEIIFDVHNLFRNRAHDMLEALTVYPRALGVNIDEDTAVVFKGDVIEAVGTGWVQIFDSTLWQNASIEQAFCSDFRLSTGRGRTLIPNYGRSHFLWSTRRDMYNVVTRETVSSDFTEADLEAMKFEL